MKSLNYIANYLCAGFITAAFGAALFTIYASGFTQWQSVRDVVRALDSVILGESNAR